MLNLGESLPDILLRSAVVYLAVLGGLRLAGKREIGQLTVFDLAVLLLLANAVQNAMVGSDTSILGGLISAATLLLLNRLVTVLRVRSPRLRRVLQGTPTVLVLHGEILVDALRHEGLDDDTFQAQLREHGFASASEVEMAVLEIDGSISVIPLMAQQMKRMRHPKLPSTRS